MPIRMHRHQPMKENTRKIETNSIDSCSLHKDRQFRISCSVYLMDCYTHFRLSNVIFRKQLSQFPNRNKTKKDRHSS